MAAPTSTSAPALHPPDPRACQGCADLAAEGFDLRRFATVEHRGSYSTMRRWHEPPQPAAQPAMPIILGPGASA